MARRETRQLRPMWLRAAWLRAAWLRAAWLRPAWLLRLAAGRARCVSQRVPGG